MGRSKPTPPDPAPEDPHPIIERDPEVRRMLRRAVHGLKRPIQNALDSARPTEPRSMTVTVHLGLAWWSRWLADSEILLGDSE